MNDEVVVQIAVGTRNGEVDVEWPSRKVFHGGTRRPKFLGGSYVVGVKRPPRASHERAGTFAPRLGTVGRAYLRWTSTVFFAHAVCLPYRHLSLSNDRMSRDRCLHVGFANRNGEDSSRHLDCPKDAFRERERLYLAVCFSRLPPHANMCYMKGKSD